MTENVALIADIGGTHARFGIVDAHGEIGHTHILRGAEYDSLDAAYQAYRAKLPADLAITRAALAVAGPVTGDEISVRNRAWHFSKTELQKLWNLDALHIINDFTAIALSLPHLKDSDKLNITAGIGETQIAPLAIVGPGTGLGVGALVPQDNGEWLAIPGEGGHVSLPACNETEAALIAILQKKFGYVSAEHVLSGQGLVNLYHALAEYQNEAAVHATPEAIADAFHAGDALAQASIQQFCRFLGTVAADAALTLGARGGVYLAGGILPKIPDILQESDFIECFVSKGPVEAYLKDIPVWLITHPLPAFVGLQFFLHRVKSG